MKLRQVSSTIKSKSFHTDNVCVVPVHMLLWTIFEVLLPTIRSCDITECNTAQVYQVPCEFL